MRESFQMDPCPACEGRDFRKLFSKKGRHFWGCLTCGLEKQHPLPTPASLAEYYDASYKEGMYRTFADAGGMKAATARWRLDSVTPFVSPGRWLDVGCANGYFVDAACRQG